MRKPQVRSAHPSLPISVCQISKAYGDVSALDHVTLNIQSGEFLTLLGPSGSGKTTLLMVLAGFVRPTSGIIQFGDKDVTREPPHRRNIGMVFQNLALFPHMNVLGNVSYPLKLRRIPKSELISRANEALHLVDLEELADRRIHQLSGGQKQRVALARAIVFEPRILLMDEPLSALDKKLRERMQIEIRHLHDKLGMTTVYVTHDQREALTMSDRIAVIDDGRILQVDTPQQLYDAPKDRFVADFIGESSVLNVSVVDGSVQFAGQSLQIMAISPSVTNGTHQIIIRPEKLSIIDSRGASDLNRLEAVVTECVFQGEMFVLYARLQDGTEVTMRGLNRGRELASIPTKGHPVTLGFHPMDAVLLSADSK